MLSSGIIDLAIGLAFVFGVTAALASVATELISRFLGLRGAYLLGGLRELLRWSGGNVRKYLRIAICQREPRALYLHHDAVSTPKSVKEVRHGEVDLCHFLRHKGLRLLPTIAELRTERLSA